MAALAPAAQANTFTVNLTSDLSDSDTTDNACDTSGVIGLQCTLRAAIQQANATAGADEIHFAILGSGVHTITPASGLPAISQALTIDGYTESGSSPNTKKTGDDATLLIELDGSGAGDHAAGLVIQTDGILVRGLVINRFGTGVFISNGNGGSSTAGSTLEGCFIGTDTSGTSDRGNSDGGVLIQGEAPFNVAAHETVGGTTPEARNLISGNGGFGVLDDEGDEDSITGNLIGTKRNGSSALGNDAAGIDLEGSIDRIGGSGVASNTVAHNGGAGITVTGAGDATILRNSIFANGGLGIDLGDDGVTPNDGVPDADTGPNGLQNFPRLRSAKTASGITTIKGNLATTPSRSFTIRFFSNPSGNEGKIFLGDKGVSTDSSGLAGFTFKPTHAVAVGDNVTATATDETTGDTSELAAPRTVVAG